MPRRRTNTSKFIYLILPLLFVLAVLVWFFSASRPVDSSNSTRVNFSIDKGQGLDAIGAELKEKKLIRSVSAFRIQVMLSNLSTKIQAGDFSIPPSFTLRKVTQALTKGTYDRWVTFLEGWRREEFAQKLVDVLEPENKDYAFDPDEFLSLTKNLEGRLFPDTYSFPKTASTSAVVKRLNARFNEQVATLKNTSGLTDDQAVIVASLVEREAITDAERPLIAGIIIKRLNNDWPLQIDATVQYLKTSRDCRLLTCDWWPNNLTREDLQIDSPYNTYKNPGLPPTPISNPSLESLKAAFAPKESDYWFYLHGLDGKVRFSRTIEEHNANIAKYLNK